MQEIVDDHKKLINSIKLLFNSANSLSDMLVPADGDYLEQIEIIQWLNHQFIVLEDAFKLLLNKNAYRSVFTSLRIVFESYWVLHLAMNGTRYYRYFNTKNKTIAKRIYSKWKTDLSTFHSKGLQKNTLNVELINRSIRVTYKGPFDSNNKLIPFYFFLLKEYNPLKAYLGREPRLIENYLTSSYIRRKKYVTQKEINANYFVFSKGVYDHLLLNKFVDKKKWQRVRVHYNFFSMWAHPNIKYVEMIGDEIKRDSYRHINEKYDFYLSRLALLYIGNLLKLLLKSFLIFAKRQQSEGNIMPLDDTLLLRRIKKFEELTDYFWFIYNKPHLAYKWQYCMYRLWKSATSKRSLNIIMPTDVPNYLVPYYENPLEILKKIRGPKYNRVIGGIEDPFK